MCTLAFCSCIQKLLSEIFRFPTDSSNGYTRRPMCIFLFQKLIKIINNLSHQSEVCTIKYVKKSDFCRKTIVQRNSKVSSDFKSSNKFKKFAYQSVVCTIKLGK